MYGLLFVCHPRDGFSLSPMAAVTLCYCYKIQIQRKYIAPVEYQFYYFLEDVKYFRHHLCIKFEIFLAFNKHII